MKTAVAIGIFQLLALTAVAPPAGAQQPIPAPLTPPSAANTRPASDSNLPYSAADDRFRPLNQERERTSALYTKIHEENTPEVDSLLRSNRCQIKRVGGQLDRIEVVMREWLEAETKYWKLWADVEQERVDGQVKNIATMEADSKRTFDLIASEKTAREDLLRRKDDLDRYGKKTQEILKQIDELVRDIRDSEARLAQAQLSFEDMTAKVRNMNATLSARLVEMRQNINRVEAYGLEMTAFYEGKRKLAQDICNTKKPDTQTAPLSKRRSK